MPFPLKRASYDDDERRAMFERLCRCGVRVNPSTLTVKVPAKMYDECDVLGDLFNERARISSRIAGKQSPAEFWADACTRPAEMARNIRAYLARTKAVLSARSLRDFVYANCRECTQFKPSLARAVYLHLAERAGVDVTRARVYDPCAGWGDRLLAALSLGVAEYHGTDPNADAHAGYRRILEFAPPHGEVHLEELPFEDVAGDHLSEHYDIVFTSPPFFNYEAYGSVPPPSDANAWLSDWLLPCQQKMMRMLRKGGCLALYIAAVPGLDIPGELRALAPPDEKITYQRGRRRNIEIFIYRKR